MYDILIKNGTIVDGTTSKHKRGDLGIRGDKIIKVAESIGGSAGRVIDASGLIVAPGFVDIQNHSDSYGAIFQNPSLESMTRQGVTTMLVGQCGSSLAPLLRGSLASIQKWTDITGVNVDWFSVAEFLKTVEKRPLGVNLATLVGHATLRRDFVGDDTRPLSEREKKQMDKLVRRSLKEGAWGISVGLEYTHARPVEEEELIDILKIASKYGGIASFHLRNEEDEIEAAVKEVIYLAEKSGVKAKISHFKKKGEQNPDSVEEILSTLKKARKRNVDIWLDVYPYTTSAMVLYLLLPEWATEKGKGALLEKLKNEKLRSEISSEIKEKKLPYEKIVIASGSIDRAVIGRTIEELSKRQQRSPEEVIFDLILSSEDQIMVFLKNFYEPVLETIMKDSGTMIATDGSGWPLDARFKKGLEHPRSFCSTARVLSRYVRKKKLISLEAAIHKMSGMPAEFMGLKKRGTIKEGNYADIVVFDENNIEDCSSFENPYRHPRGIPYVLLNGQIAIDKGESSGIFSGQVLKKP